MDVELGSDGKIKTTASGLEAVQASASIVQAQIKSQTLLKLGLYVLATCFLVVAALLVVFAPNGRETSSSIIAVALFVVAVGCAGFGTFKIKTPLVSAEAGGVAAHSKGAAPHVEQKSKKGQMLDIDDA